MPDLSTVLTSPGYTGWVYDPQRNLIEIVGGDGSLRGWSIDRQEYTLNLQLGGTPSTVDISTDGKFLIVGNKDTVQTASPTYATLTRVNLETQAIDQIRAPLTSAAQNGIVHVVTTAGGAAIFDRLNGQGGVNPFQQISLAALNPTPEGVAALASLGYSSALTRSDDHRYILIEDGIGPTPPQIYDTVSSQIIGRRGQAVSSSSLGHGDISSAANLVVDVSYGNIFVSDLTLKLVKDLSAFTSGGGMILGATFTDDGHQLLLWRGSLTGFGQASAVLVLDTQSWQQVGTITTSVATEVPVTTPRSAIGTMNVAGQVLVMDGGKQLELLDLAARMKLAVNGGASDETLWGSIGQDTLSGGGGRDVLNGGRGGDTLIGGEGGDIFNFAIGDSGTIADRIDVINDWQAADALSFGGVAATAANYSEATASSYSDAQSLANNRIAAGASYVAVGVNGDTFVFADSRGDHGAADDVVRLNGRSVADIGPENIGGALSPGGGSGGGASLPPLPPGPTGASKANIVGNMDAAHLSDLLPAVLTDATPTLISIQGQGSLGLNVGGTGFTYVNDQLVAGTATSFGFSDAPGGALNPVLRFTAQGVSVDARNLTPWLANDATQTAFQTILAGSDLIGGSPGADLIRGYAGNDLIYGLAGGDTMWGGLGDDVLYVGIPPTVTDFPFGGRVGAAGESYLRGEEGNDYIIGGDQHDDINGNMGNDTASGGLGEDWVVGGKDNDLLFGDADYDLVYGNIGNDTCEGGAGNDIVRGGQDNDIVRGGDGADFVSGDKGDDTMIGGAGADVFHTFGDAGIDRVTDFNLTEGDRVQLDPGTQFTVSQAGADTVINMTGGGQMILVGVQMSTLTPGWIFGA